MEFKTYVETQMSLQFVSLKTSKAPYDNRRYFLAKS